MKNVLVIAYYFPPTGGGGVQRTTKFVKYLPCFGWKPVVLTVKNPDFDVFDESLLNDIPSDVKVFKTYSFNPVRWHRVRRYGMNSLFDRRDKKTLTSDKRLAGLLFLPIKRTIKFFLNNFVLVPDDYVGWIPFAVIKGYRIVKKENIDVIYATGKPWSSFLIAVSLGLLTGIPCVLDLRDPWVLTPYGNYGTNSIKQRLEGFWEKICFLHARKVININEQISKSYIQHYPQISSDKFVYITHGYDRDDFDMVERKKKKGNGKFTISYIGTIYSNTSPDIFLKAVSSLFSNHKGLRDDIGLKFIGFLPAYVKKTIDDLGLSDIIETVEYLPHRESIQHMINTDVLLLLLNKVTANTSAQVSTGKIFEYLASRRPILALIPDETDAAALIRELKAGRVIEPDDLNGIENAIYEMYLEFRNGGLENHAVSLERFDRKTLTKQLAGILDRISPDTLNIKAADEQN